MLKLYTMHNKILIVILLLVSISCKSQKENNLITLDKNDYEVINIFLGNLSKDNFRIIDSISGNNQILNFTGRYLHHVKSFKRADSICRTSTDTLRLKISCPIANGLYRFNNVFSSEEIEDLKQKYNTSNQYENIDLNQITSFDSTYIDNQGLSSLRIDNLYYANGRNTAVVAYSTISISNEIYTNFFVMEKIRNIWWKPIGSFKL